MFTFKILSVRRFQAPMFQDGCRTTRPLETLGLDLRDLRIGTSEHGRGPPSELSGILGCGFLIYCACSGLANCFVHVRNL